MNAKRAASPGDAERGDGGENVLEVAGLSVDIVGRRGERRRIVRDVNLAVARGEVLGIVGESGSGKTMTLRANLSLLPDAARRRWTTCQIAGVPGGRRERWPVAMVFQDPMTSLNPLRPVGFHLTEVVARFQGVGKARARQAAVAALERVGIDDPARRFRQYPHELSGGMRQRTMIAMALLARPALLFADEPTTALDVTVQAQILDVIRQVNRDDGLSVVLVTHDLGVVAEMCHRVAVMWEGRVVEEATVDEIFYDPRHPYTVGLLNAMPGHAGARTFGSVGERLDRAWVADDAQYAWAGPTHRFLERSDGSGSAEGTAGE
ncbi:MAG: ABC transporter ATP-binding protein [Bifidobacteriaceae bacterium]|nr:ABC transporter ATP-binding protein [Bifidobacteriaceae bacterium]